MRTHPLAPSLAVSLLRRREGSVFCAAALALLTSAARAQTPPFVWIEADRAQADIKLPDARGWGHKEFLSEDKWLQVSIDADKVEKELPADGAVLRYPFTVAAAGRYTLWNRIGYEFARSPFDWRIDGGAWNRVEPDALTTDLMTIETWNEVGWISLGVNLLTPGEHSVEIRLPHTKDRDGKPARVLYASDALCLVAGDWQPYGKYKPGEEWRTERDRAAAAATFTLAPPSAEPGARSSVALSGDWEVSRDDEALPPFDIAVPLELPAGDAKWSAIPVPSDKNVARPDLVFAHRLWYRCRVQVPGSEGRSFFLTFPRNSLNTTVYVNGVRCGFNKVPNVAYSVDITRAVKPGQVNEIRVGIRDPWYAYSGSPTNPMKRRRAFNLPLSFVGNGFQDLDWPVWNAWQSGIVQTPVLTSAGSLYASDVFVQPQVTPGKELHAQVTLVGQPRGATSLEYAVVDAKTGAVVKTFRDAQEIKPRIADPAWPDAKLWWPVPDPQLYRLRVTVRDAGQIVDVSETRFGFRQWGARGKDFTLNGQVWHGWADLNEGRDPRSWLAAYRKHNQRFMRLMGYAQGGPAWLGLLPAQALDFFDENGVVVRRSGDLDGEAIGYMAIENDPELRKLYGSEIKTSLLRNWTEQMVAQVKAERNHPSIHLWSIENEWLYINCINLYGGLMDQFEAATLVCGEAVANADPTRLWMTDGGGAGKANRFPVHGDHYVFAERDGRYPDLAYDANPTGGGRGRWTWDQQRPRYLGEDFYASGINPADYAPFGGEATFGGKAAAYPATGQIQRMLTEGYRWAGYGAWHLWLGSESAVGQYGSNADLAVFVREWNWTFGSGQKVSRTLGIFNDVPGGPSGVAYSWRVRIGNREAETVGGNRITDVPAGTSKVVPIAFNLPAVTRRTEGALILTASQNGKELFRDVKPFSILPAIASGSPLLGRGGPTPVAARPAAPALAVYDPSGKVGAWLSAHKIAFTPLSSLARLPSTGVVLIGPDALSPAEATSTTLAAFAAGGGRVVVLEQKNPLKFGALPAEIESTDEAGRIAFVEDTTHPALAGLADRDFFTWAVGKSLYRGAYVKPVRGARSLLQCGPRLTQSALVEVPVGTGLILLCQATVGESAGSSAPAATLLANLLGYAKRYRQEFRPVTAALAPGSPLTGVLDAIGLKYAKASSALPAGKGVHLVSATPANVRTLAANAAKVRAFTQAGGWLILHDLTPEGLADFNRLVGVNHMIRPFFREKLGLAAAHRSPLSAGMTAGDVAMLSGVRVFPWTSDEYVADDIFRFVVDYDEVARFGNVPDHKYFGLDNGDNDHNPRNLYNGFTTSDGWVFAFMQWAGSGAPRAIPLTFSVPQTLTELEWTGNALYDPTTEVTLTFDGKEKRALKTEPNNQPQALALSPAPTTSALTLQITGWRPDRPEQPLVGIDNIRLKARRPAAFYQRVRPLTDVGGLMEYRDGAGGIVLCDLLFKESEAVPINAVKKRAILATILRNLKAPFAGARTVIAGAAGQVASPISLGKSANQYRNERGWFGDSRRTFAALPTGRQTFAGVPFEIYDFPTSPVPTAVMLGGPGVPGGLPDAVRGIAVGRKADALFFLQTARIDQPRDDRERRERKRYELARYVVTYDDGKTEAIPLYQDEDLADFRQKSPAALPGALLGWSRPYENSDESATAWVKPWTNPRPEVAIRSIDLEYGKDRRGVPVLLAVTTVTTGR